MISSQEETGLPGPPAWEALFLAEPPSTVPALCSHTSWRLRGTGHTVGTQEVPLNPFLKSA